MSTPQIKNLFFSIYDCDHRGFSTNMDGCNDNRIAVSENETVV